MSKPTGVSGSTVSCPVATSTPLFGGDWNPIIPCQEPTTNPVRAAQLQLRGDNNFPFCIPDGQRVDPDELIVPRHRAGGRVAPARPAIVSLPDPTPRTKARHRPQVGAEKDEPNKLVIDVAKDGSF